MRTYTYERISHSHALLQIPKIDNTNIDRSIATIHSCVLGCIRRFVMKNEPFWDKTTNTAAVVLEECVLLLLYYVSVLYGHSFLYRYERQSFVSSSRMLKYLESKALAKAMMQEGADKDPEGDPEDVRENSSFSISLYLSTLSLFASFVSYMLIYPFFILNSILQDGGTESVTGKDEDIFDGGSLGS